MRLVIPVVLFSLAAWFALGPRAVVLPEPAVAVVSLADLSTDPPRVLPAALDEVVIGGLEQRCSDCHALFESAELTPTELRQHTDIVMDHGLNEGCLNCHARKDRDQLELYDGELVPMSRSELLCAKCHGPTYRDWVEGMHGRAEGSWMRDDPEHRLLLCIECHDPHAPAFPDLVPLPGPNSWRAPAVGHGHEDDGSNPLRRNHRNGGAAADHAPVPVPEQGGADADADADQEDHR